MLRAFFPDRHDSKGIPDWDLPLFPAITGGVVKKEAMVATIEKAGEALNIAHVAPDGSERLSGAFLASYGRPRTRRFGLALVGDPAARQMGLRHHEETCS